MKTTQNKILSFRKIVLGSALALALATGARAATVYNVVGDFVNTSNPNGAWSYLYDISLAAGGAHDGDYTLFTEQSGNGSYGWTAYAPFNTLMYLTDASGDYTNPAARNHLTMVTSAPPPTYQWQSLILTWTAPSQGLVDVNYQVNNVAPQSDAVNIALDLYSGGVRSNIIELFSLASGASYNAVANAISVNAGDQIQFYRDGYVNQQGQIILGPTSTVSFTAIPEPSTWALMAFTLTAGMLIRRRSRA